MRILFGYALLASALAVSAFGQAKKKTISKSGPGSGAEDAKWKAIWEPVPFNKDIWLQAISCTGPETCWVAGDKGTILHTSDGGKNWQVQLGGDPESTDEDLEELFMLDAKHGWVMSKRNKVLGSSDGASWAALSTLPGTARSITFISPQVGFAIDNSDSQSRSMLNRTLDGGKSWKRTDPCSVDMVVGGLARKLGCLGRYLRFASARTGYMGGSTVPNPVAVVAKTADGGATWTTSVIPETRHQIDEVHFWSETDGLVLLSSGQTYWTADGGGSWTGSANAPAWKSYYASGEGKILVGVNANGRQIGYSFNGGRSFSSRAANLPARVSAVTFPDARHGYLVGEHGMVYRYRIVPADYSVPGMIGAPGV